MNFFLKLAFLFLIGSMFGWVLELFYRKIASSGKWINPGFLVGPYLPLYGFGLCAFYLLSQMDLDGISTVLVMMTSVTIIEYIAGLIFIKGMGVKLWDYSNEWANVDGLICPKYTIFWGVLGAGYYYLLHPFILNSISWVENNLILCFIIGFFFGIIVIDLIYTTQLVVKIRKFAREKGLIIKYEEFKAIIVEQAIKNKEKYSFIFAISNNVKSIEKNLNAYMKDQLAKTSKIKSAINLFIKDKVKIKKSNTNKNKKSDFKQKGDNLDD